mmetsp:Transcript_25689/g.74296  ORF Transcript_25689/g.74296 Transcript_25689/m.74296 type:complete len:358 (+) Transcript_25689:219-1292(+)
MHRLGRCGARQSRGLPGRSTGGGPRLRDAAVSRAAGCCVVGHGPLLRHRQDKKQGHSLEACVRKPGQAVAHVPIDRCDGKGANSPGPVHERGHPANGLAKLSWFHRECDHCLHAGSHEVLSEDKQLGGTKIPPLVEGDAHRNKGQDRTGAAEQDAASYADALNDAAVQEQVHNQAQDAHTRDGVAPEQRRGVRIAVEELVLQEQHADGLEGREAEAVEEGANDDDPCTAGQPRGRRRRRSLLRTGSSAVLHQALSALNSSRVWQARKAEKVDATHPSSSEACRAEAADVVHQAADHRSEAEPHEDRGLEVGHVPGPLLLRCHISEVCGSHARGAAAHALQQPGAHEEVVAVGEADDD